MQTLNLLALHARLKAEIEIGERFDDGQPRRAHRGLEAARIAQLDVRAEQLLDRVARADLAGVTAAEDVVERFERARHLEIGELRAEALAERRARRVSRAASWLTSGRERGVRLEVAPLDGDVRDTGRVARSAPPRAAGRATDTGATGADAAWLLDRGEALGRNPLRRRVLPHIRHGREPVSTCALRSASLRKVRP